MGRRRGERKGGDAADGPNDAGASGGGGGATKLTYSTPVFVVAPGGGGGGGAGDRGSNNSPGGAGGGFITGTLNGGGALAGAAAAVGADSNRGPGIGGEGGRNDATSTGVAGSGPNASVVVLPAVSGGGKSTLTAALVAAGWDYLGDEAIGIASDGTALGYPKRLRLDSRSRDLLGLGRDPDQTIDPTLVRGDVRRLGGPVGPVTRIVFPCYQAGMRCEVEPLGVHDHLDELIANTLNLARVGEDGVGALCRLADTVEADRITYSNALEAAEVIADGLG
jgi:hypothetical protein